MSLFDRTNTVSKESPSSLLGEPDASAPRPLADVPLKSDGPSGLLPPEERGRYPAQKPEDLAAVSPSSLLPPAESGNRRRLMLWGGAASAVVLILLLLLFGFGSKEKPLPELMQDAIASLNAGRFEEASIHLKNVLRRDPTNAEANVLLGRAYLRMGSYLDAEKALRQVQEKGNASDDVAAMLVEALLELDRSDDALKELGSASNLSRLGPKSAQLLGRANLGVGNFADAKTHYTILRNSDPAAGMAGLARVLMMEGDADGARKLTSELVEKYPGDVEAWMVRADFLRGMSEEKDALDAYRKVQSLKSDHLDAALGLAVILIGQGEFGDAQREIKKARAISPASHRLAFVNALLAYRERRYGDAREYLSAILSTAPQHMPSVLLVGALSLEVADFEQAQNAFTAYLARFPGNLQARKLLALTFLNKKQPHAAADLLAPFIQLDVRDFEYFAVAGQAFLQTNDVKRALDALTRAAALNPKSADVWSNLGLAKYAAGSEQEGFAALEKAIALAPRDSRPDRHLALAYIARNRFDDAERVVTGLGLRLPQSPESHWLRGVIAVAKKQPTDGRAHYERALKVAPGYLPAAASLSELDAREGHKERIRARFESVLQANPRSVEAILALAQVDANEGKHVDGVRRLQRAAEQHPENAQLFSLLASLQSHLRNDEDAIQSVRRARELNPRDTRAIELLGQLQSRAGDHPAAILSFTTLVGQLPRNLSAWLQLIHAQRAAGERRAALASARQAQRLAPDDPNLLGMLGDVLIEDRRFDEALVVARIGQEQHSRLSYGFAIEGQVRLLQGNAGQASALFREADQRQPTGLVRIRIHQAESALLGRDAPVDLLLAWLEANPTDAVVQRYTGDVLVRLGQIERGVALYEKALKSEPDDFRVLNNLADALLRKGDPQGALGYAQQAFQQRPNDTTVLTTMGAVLLERGSLAEAVQTLQKATDIDPDNLEGRFHLARALLAAGDRARAKVELQRLLRATPAFVRQSEARRLLEQL